VRVLKFEIGGVLDEIGLNVLLACLLVYIGSDMNYTVGAQ